MSHGPCPTSYLAFSHSFSIHQQQWSTSLHPHQFLSEDFLPNPSLHEDQLLRMWDVLCIRDHLFIAIQNSQPVFLSSICINSYKNLWGRLYEPHLRETARSSRILSPSQGHNIKGRKCLFLTPNGCTETSDYFYHLHWVFVEQQLHAKCKYMQFFTALSVYLLLWWRKVSYLYGHFVYNRPPRIYFSDEFYYCLKLDSAVLHCQYIRD